MFAQKHFETQKLGNSEDQLALLTVFPEIANAAVNKYLRESTADIEKNLSKTKAAQEWEIKHKPSTDCEENEETTKFKTELADHLRWMDGYNRRLEEYRKFAGKPGSNIDSNLMAYCDAVVSWLNLIVEFKHWQGEFHHRETVSVYTTKYYYHKYKMIPLFYDTSWEYSACNRYKTSFLTVRREAAARNEAELAKKAAEEKKRVAEYWAAHSEEKNELETARANLQMQVNKLNAKFKNSDELQIQKELEEELNLLKSQRSSLGLFNFKEKKAVDEKINSKEIEIMRAKKKCEELEYQINNKVKDLQYKILKINDRLNLIGTKLEL